MSITSVEIARLCGVSRATVDRALKNKPGISSETRERILSTAAQHGYRPNHLARSLSTGHSSAVGVIVFDLRNRHFSWTVDAIERYFSERSVFTYICLSDKNPERERLLLDSLAALQVDGIILIPINQGSEFEESLRRLSLPVVAVSNRLDGFPYVGGDNFEGVLHGMQHLYDCGCHTVHFVCPPLRRRGKENLYAQERRAEGYLHFMKPHPDMRGELISDKDYLNRIEELLDNSPGKPAFFCSSDIYMLEIRRRLLDKGLKPSDVCTLMGFDGSDILDHLTQRPASVSYPAEAIGMRAAQLLDNLMNGSAAETEVLLPCPLLPGNIPD